jgi:hypothetical protein
MILASGIPYEEVEERWRWRWHEVARTQAPPLMRVAAFGCFFFGGCLFLGGCCNALAVLVPELSLLWLLTLLAAAAFLIASVKLYRAGLRLLRREPRTSYFRARNAAYWALGATALVLLIGILLSLTQVLRDLQLDFHETLLGDDVPEVPNWTLLAIFGGYCVPALAHALFVLRITTRWDDALLAPSQTTGASTTTE